MKQSNNIGIPQRQNIPNRGYPMQSLHPSQQQQGFITGTHQQHPPQHQHVQQQKHHQPIHSNNVVGVNVQPHSQHQPQYHPSQYHPQSIQQQQHPQSQQYPSQHNSIPSRPSQGILPHPTHSTVTHGPGQTSGYPPISRFADLFDAMRHEFEALSEAASMYKLQRDEYEHKLGSQVNELSSFQQNLYELERAHQQMKIQYEEEIMRLRRELDLRSDTTNPTSGEVVLNKRSRPDDSLNSTTGYPVIQKIPKLDNEIYRNSMVKIVSQTMRSNYQGQGMPQPGPHSRPIIMPRPSISQIPSHIMAEVQGVCDFDIESVPPQFRKEVEDWAVAFNPKSSVLQGDRLNIDLIQSLEHDSVVCCIRFSTDGKLLATGCNRYAQIFDVLSGQKICTLEDTSNKEFTSYIRSVAFSPDSKYLATGVEDNIIRVWNISKVSIVFYLSGHTHDIYSLEWTKDGKFLVSGSGDGTVRVWDADNGQNLMTLANSESENFNEASSPHERGVTSTSLNPVYQRCVAAGCLDKFIRIWDVKTGHLLERLEGHIDSVYSVAFSPDGRSIVSGSLDKMVKIWDLSPQTLNYLSLNGSNSTTEEKASPLYPATFNTTPRHTYAGHKDYVLSVAFPGMNCNLGRVDENGDPVATPGGDALAEIEWIVSGSKDRMVTFWDGRRGNEILDPAHVALFSLQGHKNSVISLAVAPNGGLFATGSGDNTSKIWRVYADRGVNPLPPAGPAHRSQFSTHTAQATHSISPHNLLQFQQQQLPHQFQSQQPPSQYSQQVHYQQQLPVRYNEYSSQGNETANIRNVQESSNLGSFNPKQGQKSGDINYVSGIEQKTSSVGKVAKQERLIETSGFGLKKGEDEDNYDEANEAITPSE